MIEDFDLSKFKERLKERREKLGVNKAALSRILNLDRSHVCNYETGRRMPSLAVLVKMALLFNVSTDYLIGLSDEPRKIDERK